MILKVQMGAAFLPRSDEDLQPSFQSLTQNLDHQAVETRYSFQAYARLTQSLDHQAVETRYGFQAELL
jgi:hypothetical protein